MIIFLYILIFLINYIKGEDVNIYEKITEIERRDHIGNLKINNIVIENHDREKFSCNLIFIDSNVFELIIKRWDSDELGWDKKININLISDNHNFNYDVGLSDDNEKRIIINTNLILKKSNYNQNIPKIIYQTNENAMIDSKLFSTVEQIITSNPEYEYEYYDDNKRYEFIEQNFVSRVLKAYNLLIPGAYKADLFRLAILYIKGGFYIDCKAIPILPLRDLIDSNEDLILCKDNGHQRIYNAYIGCIPNHPLIGKFLYSLVDNVINMNYGNGPLDITGPQFLGKIFNKLTNNYPIELGNFKFENYTNNIKYEHKNQKGFNTFDKNNSLIFIRSYSGYNKKKEFDYNYYYGQRKVFKT